VAKGRNIQEMKTNVAESVVVDSGELKGAIYVSLSVKD
jgi:hypothetical protein